MKAHAHIIGLYQEDDGMDNFSQEVPAQKQPGSGASSAPASNAAVEQDFDDDIPF